MQISCANSFLIELFFYLLDFLVFARKVVAYKTMACAIVQEHSTIMILLASLLNVKYRPLMIKLKLVGGLKFYKFQRKFAK